MSNPKVSVVIPVYNGAKFLDKCLTSIINQTLKEIEIICVNDGSTDNSQEIMQKYAKEDSRIKIISRENMGSGRSYNDGIDAATGEYVTVVDNDDFVELNMYENLYKLAIKNNSDIVKSNWYNYYTEENRRTKLYKIPPKYIDKIVTPKDIDLIFDINPSVWSGIYKRSYLNENNIRYTNTPGASYQDNSFTFKVYTLTDKITLTSKAYYHYRYDNPTSSIHSNKYIYAVCDEYQEIDNFLLAHPDIKKKYNTLKLKRQFHAYQWNLQRISDDYKLEFAQKISEEFKTYSEKNELTEDLYKYIPRKKVKMLMENPEAFCELSIKKNKEKQRKSSMKKLFYIKLNPKCFILELFGKKIIEM